MNKKKISQSMEVVILAAGNATRCQPLSSIYNKPMLPILGTPLIGRIIHSFEEIGIKKFYIIYGKKEDQLKPYIKDLISREQLNIKLIKQPKAMGMADAVLLAKEELLSTLTNSPMAFPFIITAGDVLFPSNMISKMIDEHLNTCPIATLGIFHSSDPIIGTHYANIDRSETNLITKIIEKPGKNKLISQLFSMPLFIFSPKMFSFLEKVPISQRGEKEVQDGIQMAIISGASVRSSMLISHSINSEEDGQYHLTFPRDFLSMNWRMLKEESIQGRFKNTSVIPPISGNINIIGHNTIIGPNVYLSVNTKIGDNCKIQDTYCFPKSHIKSSSVLSNCIIGENVEILASTNEKSKIFLTSGIYPLK